MNTRPDCEDFLRLLEVHRVDYTIVGGYAVAHHGFPLFTTNIGIFFSDAADILRGRRRPHLPAHKPSSVIDPRPDVGGEECQTGQLSAALRSPSTLRSTSTEAGQAAAMSCAA